ncbi:MAG: hypothetical protein ABI616_03300 [Pseudomonadota bacterium]
MKMVCIALLCAAGANPPSQAADSPPVTAQQLNAVASSKVGTVLWTRRTDRYTLQVVFPRRGRPLPVDEGRTPANPVVTLWLLRADGTAISAVREAPHPVMKGALADEVEFSTSLAGGEEAVAAAIQIDDEYFIEPLRPMSHKGT